MATTNPKADATKTRKKRKEKPEREPLLVKFSADIRLREIAEEIIDLKDHVKSLNDQATNLFKEAEALHVPKKSLQLALKLLNDKKRDQFDRGLAKMRRILQIEPQLEFTFDKAEE